ncbi:MAG: hypothetical protein R3F14_20275 [Polyangiaceae bacterium]
MRSRSWRQVGPSSGRLAGGATGGRGWLGVFLGGLAGRLLGGGARLASGPRLLGSRLLRGRRLLGDRLGDRLLGSRLLRGRRLLGDGLLRGLLRRPLDRGLCSARLGGGLCSARLGDRLCRARLGDRLLRRARGCRSPGGFRRGARGGLVGEVLVRQVLVGQRLLSQVLSGKLVFVSEILVSELFVSQLFVSQLFGGEILVLVVAGGALPRFGGLLRLGGAREAEPRVEARRRGGGGLHALEDLHGFAREGLDVRVDLAAVVLGHRHEGERDLVFARVLPRGGAAAAGERLAGGHVDAHAGGGALGGGGGAAERDAPIDRGERDLALVDEVRELVGDGLFQLQASVRRAEGGAERGGARFGRILQQASVGALSCAGEGLLHHLGGGALRGLRGDVAERFERDLDVGLLGLAPRAIGAEERVLHHAEHVAANDRVLGEDVLDMVRIHERRRDVLDHLLDGVVERLVAEGAGDLVVDDAGGRHAADDRREPVVHAVGRLADESWTATLAEQDVTARGEHVGDLGGEILGQGGRHGAQLTR